MNKYHFEKFTGVIDFISRLQRIMIYPLVALVCITCIDIIARSVFNAPLIWAYDVETQLFAGLITLCWAYSLQKGAQVRISVMPDKFLSPRGRDIIMIINYLIFFFPFVTILFIYGSSYAWDSWSVREVSTITPWQPIVYPIKATIPLAASMLFLQGVSETIKHIVSAMKAGAR